MTLDPSKMYNNVGDLAQGMGANFAADVKSKMVITGTGYYAKRAINGITVNLHPEKTYESPYLSMVHAQGTAVIRHPGYPNVELELGGLPNSENPKSPQPRTSVSQ